MAAQMGLSANAQPRLGRQLSRRVSSGEISQEQAERTAQERSVLAKTYGPDWRRKVYGDRGYTQRTRRQLAENPNDPALQALYTNLLKRRQSMLNRARRMA